MRECIYFAPRKDEFSREWVAMRRMRRRDEGAEKLAQGDLILSMLDKFAPFVDSDLSVRVQRHI